MTVASVMVANVMVASVIHDSYQFQIDSQHIIGFKNKLDVVIVVVKSYNSQPSHQYKQDH